MASIFILIPGSPIVRDPLQRATFLSLHANEWALMWGTWTMASLSLFGFYWALGMRLSNRPPRMLRAVAWTMLVALGVDVSSQVGYAVRTPAVARDVVAAKGDERAGAVERLIASERTPAVLSGGIANGLYSLAGVMLCIGAARDPRFPRALRWGSLPAWAGGFALVAASLAGDPTWVALTTFIAIGGFMLWCAAVMAFFFWRHPPAFRTVEASA